MLKQKSTRKHHTTGAVKSVAVLLVLGLTILLWQGVAFAAEIANDSFESGDFSGGTGWLASWQNSGSVDLLNDGDPQVSSWHMRLRGGNGVAYRDASLTGLSDLELTVWVKADSFEEDEYAALLIGPPGSLTEVQRWVGEDYEGDDDDDDDDDEGGGDDDYYEAEEDNEYHLYSFDLNSFDTSGTFRVQFESHMSGDNDRLYVDSVAISDGEPSGQDTEIPPVGSTSLSEIELDSEFDDWDGHANLPDPSGDAQKTKGDILTLYWGDNTDDGDSLYWMVERPTGQTKLVRYSLHLDMNNNGDFDESTDRIVEVYYQPGFSRSWVTVKVSRADDNQVISVQLLKDWGETISEGGSRIEFGVETDDLGFSFGSAFRMYMESNWDDRVPDTGDIQWSPMPILGIIGMAVLLLGGGASIWWFKLRKFEGKEVPQT